MVNKKLIIPQENKGSDKLVGNKSLEEVGEMWDEGATEGMEKLGKKITGN